MLKDLQRVLAEVQGSPTNPELESLLEQVSGMPFLEFWDLIGPPISAITGKPSPLHKFQQQVIEELETHGRIAVLKARAMGLSEIAIRYCLYMILSKQIPGNYIFVTGIGLELSRSLRRRASEILENLGIYSEDRDTVISFPSIGARIQCYPADSKSWRGLSNVKFLVVDEFSWFEASQNPLPATDAYAIKDGGAKIWLITTPSNIIGGFAHRLFSERNPERQLYKIIELPYQVAVGTMYSQQQIDLLKRTSDSFSSEFELKWGVAHTGNTFRLIDIERCQRVNYNPDEKTSNPKAIAVDPAWGSSATAVSMFEVRDDHLCLTYNEEFRNASSEEMVQLILELYHVQGNENVSTILVDSSQISFIKSLKQAFADAGIWYEDVDYETRIAFYKTNKADWRNNMRIQPVYFNEQNNKAMLSHLKYFVESGLLAIDKRFDKAITALQTCTDEDGKVLKGRGRVSNDDTLDTLRMGCTDFGEFTWRA